MNKFDQYFFKKFVPESSTIKWVIHEHIIVILDRLIVELSFFVFLPSFLYYYSDRFRELIPFVFFEWFLILIFFKIMYDIIDWYNDVWIITDDGVVDLDWKLFDTNAESVNYDNIEWIEIEQSGIWDMILRKWNIVIHKIWSDHFRLDNATVPYEAVDEIDRAAKWIHNLWNENTQKEPINMEIIAEALSGVVWEYLDRQWIKTKKKDEDPVNKVKYTEWTIDLRD